MNGPGLAPMPTQEFGCPGKWDPQSTGKPRRSDRSHVDALVLSRLLLQPATE
jgi:hypothetical protein